MSFESEADRLAMIRALGGVVFIGPKGSFEAIFEKPAVALGDLAVITAAPTLTARAVDLERAGVRVGSLVRGQQPYLVRDMRDDGEGMTVVDLELP